ncbi:hypothetical protein DOTSEDRAFT_56897 [Dothistroma septosporum NZE10]|uniref:Uncharacterized protein n=1 Tax=Dothistroma septosporum (strain NZE10 / CBS 128990) TaxID=675120 RepID=M2XJB3_DOTSN|nr:hypothetical protein DOTSEDRAFT_56897 [Dothistroma septosporum NZE10]
MRSRCDYHDTDAMPGFIKSDSWTMFTHSRNSSENARLISNAFANAAGNSTRRDCLSASVTSARVSDVDYPEAPSVELVSRQVGCNLGSCPPMPDRRVYSQAGMAVAANNMIDVQSTFFVPFIYEAATDSVPNSIGEAALQTEGSPTKSPSTQLVGPSATQTTLEKRSAPGSPLASSSINKKAGTHFSKTFDGHDICHLVGRQRKMIRIDSRDRARHH